MIWVLLGLVIILLLAVLWLMGKLGQHDKAFMTISSALVVSTNKVKDLREELDELKGGALLNSKKDGS